jgi:hypothetical protein
MRVAHLSLDLFLDPFPRWAGPGPARLSDDVYRPWTAETLRAFLEERCLLGSGSRVPGRVVTAHEGAFDVWKEWIDAGALKAPFDLVHLDAHASLGRNDEGWFYVLGRLLHLPPGKRREGDLRRITPDNYLLFALALGWIRSITLVTHPDWEEDVHPLLYGDGEPPPLVLPRYDPHLLERGIEGGAEFPEPLAVEGPFPFEVLGSEGFQADAPFDRITVSRSPNFTPPGPTRSSRRSSRGSLRLDRSFLEPRLGVDLIGGGSGSTGSSR